MLWFKRFGLVSLTLFLLVGCGFRPLYGGRSGPNVSLANMAQIEISPIAERLGQMLRNELLAQLTPNGSVRSPLYTLNVTVTETTSTLGVRKDATATRANLFIKAQYTLNTKDGGIYTDSVEATMSYNILNAIYATVAAEKDSRKRGIVEISNVIRTQLATFFRDKGLRDIGTR